MIRWRWDQGRLSYFQFGNIRRIAKKLAELDGIDLHIEDPLREFLPRATGLPFAPHRYTVWRNYARVFGCSMLATCINDKLVATELCYQLAKPAEDSIDVDEYLSFIVPRFYYPSPVFQEYNTTQKRIYPFCATIKYLVSKYRMGILPKATLKEIYSKLVGNSCSGEEPLSYYENLNDSVGLPKGDEPRQLRELLIFFSQFSFFKWSNGTLYLDVGPGDRELIANLEALAQPKHSRQKRERQAELLSLAQWDSATRISTVTSLRDEPTDIVFTEGRKVRVTHLKTERSPRLRTLFMNSLEHYRCNMCDIDYSDVYEWIEHILEVHHLLPLSSPLALSGRGNSIKDLVALCPNCHKSIHKYYINWLNRKKIDDFRSVNEAIDVYNQAKEITRVQFQGWS